MPYFVYTYVPDRLLPLRWRLIFTPYLPIAPRRVLLKTELRASGEGLLIDNSFVMTGRVDSREIAAGWFIEVSSFRTLEPSAAGLLRSLLVPRNILTPRPPKPTKIRVTTTVNPTIRFVLPRSLDRGVSSDRLRDIANPLEKNSRSTTRVGVEANWFLDTSDIPGPTKLGLVTAFTSSCAKSPAD